MKKVTMTPKTLKESLNDPTLLALYPEGFEPPLPALLRQSYRQHRALREAGEPFEVQIPGRGVLTWQEGEVPLRRFSFRAEERYGRSKGLDAVTEGRW